MFIQKSVLSLILGSTFIFIHLTAYFQKEQGNDVDLNELEMEDDMDIDELDVQNPLAVVDYVEEIYGFYRQREVNIRRNLVIICWSFPVH